MLKLPLNAEKLLETYDPAFAFGYGSGVALQNGYKKDDKPQVDLIFAVEDIKAWHVSNILTNMGDYSLTARMLGINKITALNNAGTGLYYHQGIHFDGHTIKYGVMSVDALVDDLENWTSLYAAGRMHKPVAMIKENERVAAAQRKNLESALNAALLMMSDRFDEFALYMTIAGLSYNGDIRNLIAENPNKVLNLVEPHMEGFNRLYMPLLRNMPNISADGKGFRQDKSREANLARLSALPANVVSGISHEIDCEDYVKVRSAVEKSIRQIVFRSSVSEPMKCVFSVGPINSAIYLARKVGKRFL